VALARFCLNFNRSPLKTVGWTLFLDSLLEKAQNKVVAKVSGKSIHRLVV
jgi:hypothetical protein